jgi:hypothetical protein
MSGATQTINYCGHNWSTVTGTLIWKVGYVHKVKYLTMNLPSLQGTCDHSDFFIYAACDATYFDQFAPAFINSIRYNTAVNIHIHLFNPRTDQIDYCQQSRVSTTWEHVSDSLFDFATQRWHNIPADGSAKLHYERTVSAMTKGGDANLAERIKKTYYACARFVRLVELFQSCPVLALDIDAVIRKPLPMLPTNYNFYLHHITGRKARYLAGGIWINPTDLSRNFLKEYRDQLVTYLNNNYIYWGLDQDLLDPIVPRYNHGQLPISYIDWNMSPDSYIWTAKGTRKDLVAFVSEQQKYVA